MSVHLTARNVSRRYDVSTVVNGVSLDLEPGKITALLGGSGAGKSALLHRVVSRRWEREYRPTRSSVQLFWSPPREVLDGLDRPR